MRSAVILALLTFLAAPAHAADSRTWVPALSMYGDLKYPPGFSHFDSVNPDAPKGGKLRLGAFGTFETLNMVPTGPLPPAGLGMVYQSLMAHSPDEPSAYYGELAESVSIAPDFSGVTFRLNPNARWHDGQPVSPEDVVWSFDAWKANNLMRANYYRHVVKAEVTGDRDITFTFDKPGNRELPLIVGELTILPKYWWLANGPDGKPRDVSKPSLELPLGSGPYRVASFNLGSDITFEHVPNWWAANLPSQRGTNNFDRIIYTYYRDDNIMREAFKADAFDFAVESSAKNWATAYDIAAVKDGRIVREKFPVTTTGRMQGYAFNLRRAKFADIRVRQALGWVFDFEDLNRRLMYGDYTRIASYFAGTELAATGLPSESETKILDAVRDNIPADIFTKPFVNPVNGTDEARRANLRSALALLRSAGWVLKNRKLTNTATSEAMSIEILLNSPALEAHTLAYKDALERLGIAVAIRIVDASQFQRREDSRDFDMISFIRPESLSPGNEQRSFWGSAAADQPASDNIMGIKNPAVDALIERVIYAKDRADLVDATRALDRVLMAGYYVVPQWYFSFTRTLRWDRFSGPSTLPVSLPVGGFPTVWWYDEAKAAKTGAAK